MSTNSRIIFSRSMSCRNAACTPRNSRRVAAASARNLSRARACSGANAARCRPARPPTARPLRLGLLQLAFERPLLGGIADAAARWISRRPRTAAPRCRGCAARRDRRPRPAPRSHWRRNPRCWRPARRPGGRRNPGSGPRTGRPGRSVSATTTTLIGCADWRSPAASCRLLRRPVGKGGLCRAGNAGGEHVACLAGLEAGQQPGDIGQTGDLAGRQFHRCRRGRDQRFEPGRGARQRFEDAGRGHRNLVQGGGGHVVAVEFAAAQVKPGE